MLPLPSISFSRSKINWWAIGLVTAYLLIFVFALRTYMLWQSVNMLLGLVAIPLVTVIDRNRKGSLRYAIVALLIAAVALWVPVNTLLYFAILFAAFFLAETFIGKINMLPLLVVALMSPVFQYMANVFSFPVRLQLTQWAGSMLKVAGVDAWVQGNMITCNNNQFSVDPACMGLNMMVTSLLLQTILVAIYQKRYGKQAPWWQVLLLLAVVTLLNIFSNLSRIVLLVWFNIQPGTAMHEAAGIACLLLYIIVPSIFITARSIQWLGKEPRMDAGIVAGKMHRSVHLLLVALLLTAAIGIDRHDKKVHTVAGNSPVVNGYTTQQISNDILKLEDSRSLIYIKSIPGFYSAEHNPMICWRGSGYELKQIAEEKIAGLHVYTAQLQNGDDRLYTAWWYDNGLSRTNDQLAWRMDALTGGNNYSVLNVTAASKEILLTEIQRIIRENIVPRLCLPQKQTALIPSRLSGAEMAVGFTLKPNTDYE